MRSRELAADRPAEFARGGGLARGAGDALIWKAAQLSGTKGIFLIRTVILARLLSPDDFGLLAIGTVVLGFLMKVSELGMTQALVHQADIREEHYDSAWTVNMLRAVCVSSLLIAAAPAIAALFSEPRSVGVLRLLALKPLFDAGSSIKTAELARNLRFRSLACVSLPAVVVETLVSVSLASIIGVWALVVGALAGAVTALVMSYVVAPHRPRLLFARTAVRRLIRFGRWVFLTGLVAVSGTLLTQLVISRRLGAVDLGLYVLAGKLAFLPHEVASQVTGDVTFSLFARIQHDTRRVAKAFRSILVALATLMLPIYTLLIALAPWLVSDLLGQRWSGTEPLIQALALVGVFGLFGDVSGPMLRGLGHPQWILCIELWQSTVVILLLWALTGRYGVLGAPAAWLVAVGSSQLLSLVFARRLIAAPLAGSLRPLAMIAAASLAGAGSVMALHQGLPGPWGMVVAGGIGATVTITIIWFCDAGFDLGLRADFGEVFPQLARLLRFTGAAPVGTR